MNNYGYQNEDDFVSLFNNKYFWELDERSQSFLKELFEDNIDENEKIISWKNSMFQKTDFFIKYKNYVKSISLKCGRSNSVHCEQIQEFKRYLEHLRIPYKEIEKYMSYHYGYMRDSKGKSDYSKQLSGDEYKMLYQKELDSFNNTINKTKIIIEMIDRFIIRGKNSDYDIDALVHGTIDDYVWIKKYDLYDLILSKRSVECTSPHIACLTIGPKKRCLDGNLKNYRDRYIVAVRWNYIRENIIEYKLKLTKRDGG